MAIRYGHQLMLALVGAGGAVLGVLVTTVDQIVLYWLKERPANRLAKLRKELLRKMLNDQRWNWRKLRTLTHVIGADEAATKALC